MELWEIFNHSHEIHWRIDGNFELGAFVENGTTYVIQLERKDFGSLIPELRGKSAAEVSFFVAEKEENAAFSTLDGTKAPTKVYGAVLNAVAAKFDEYGTFYFSAELRHSRSREEFEQKASIYKAMVHNVVRRANAK